MREYGDKTSKTDSVQFFSRNPIILFPCYLTDNQTDQNLHLRRRHNDYSKTPSDGKELSFLCQTILKGKVCNNFIYKKYLNDLMKCRYDLPYKVCTQCIKVNISEIRKIYLMKEKSN